MSKVSSYDNELIVTFFYELIADWQTPVPSELPIEQADFVRLTVDAERAAISQTAAVDFERIWQQAFNQAEEVIGIGQPEVPDNLPTLNSKRVLVSLKPRNWRLSLVAGLAFVIMAGLVILLVGIQSGLNQSPVASNSINTAASLVPPTPTSLPKATFSGFDLAYPNSNPLVLASGQWLNDNPAQALINPARFAFGSKDKADTILSYYRQKLAGYSDYIEDRPASAHQFHQGLVAYKGESMLVINLIIPSIRDNFDNTPAYFKLFGQLQPDQTLLLISYGQAPALPALPDLNLPGSTNLANFDLAAWPELGEPFVTIDNSVMVRTTRAAFATDEDFVDVVNRYKDMLTKAGYEIDRDTNNDIKTCAASCQRAGWDVLSAFKESRSILIRIYGPTRRSVFKPEEIQLLTAQGLKPNQTLISYKTGLSDSYWSVSRPTPDPGSSLLSWSPDGTVLAVSQGKKVRLYKNGSTLFNILDDFQASVNKLAWSPDGKSLAISSGYGLQIWSVQTQKLTPFATSHTAPIKILAWSPDSQILASAAGCLTPASGSCDQRVFLWQQNGSLLATLPGHQGSPNVALWSPDGQQIATEQNDADAANNGTVRIWNRQGNLIFTLAAHPVFGENMAWLPSKTEKVLITSSPSSQGIQGAGLWFWNTGNGTLTKKNMGTFNDVTALVWSPDGTLLAVAETDHTIKLWRYADGLLLKSLNGHTDRVSALVWSPDGKTLASVSWDNTIRLWDNQGNQLNILSGSSEHFSSVAWSKDSLAIYSISLDKKLWLWDPANKDKPLVNKQDYLPGSSSDLVSWSPDGSVFAVYYQDGSVGLWNKKFYNQAMLYP